MIWVASRRPYGRIDVVGGTFVVTNFWCFNFLPLFPTETHLVLARAANGECTSVVVPLRGASIVAGYARPWGVVATLAAAFAVLTATEGTERLHALIALGIGLTVCAAAWLLVGRVGGEERARREVYRSIAAHPVDPAWLPDEERRDLAERLRGELAARSPAVAPATYREGPGGGWEQVALDPRVGDADFLARAAVLARIEWRAADRSGRRRLQHVHDESMRRQRQTTA